MKKINLDIMAKILVLLGFTIFFIKIILNNEIKLYVHPRIIPFVYIAVLLMIIIGAYLSTQIFSINRKKFKLQNNIIFIIPLVMIAFFETASATTSPETNNSDKMFSFMSDSSSDVSSNTSDTSDNSKNQSYDILNNSSNTSVDNSTYYDDYLYGGKTQSGGENTSLSIEDNVIKIRPQNFVDSLDEIINNTSKYDENEVEITGFIYNDKNLSLNENQFIIARYMMVCCAADMQIAGLRCEYNLLSQSSYGSGTWVKISGKIKADTYEGASDPLIIIDKIEEDPNPDTSYVYPY